MKCRALRGFYLADVAHKAGDAVEVPDLLVRQLELVGKIERLPQDPAPQATAQPSTPPADAGGPMTTASAPGLVQGAKSDKQKGPKP